MALEDDFGRSAAEYICRELREADEANLLDEEGCFNPCLIQCVDSPSEILVYHFI